MDCVFGLIGAKTILVPVAKSGRDKRIKIEGILRALHQAAYLRSLCAMLDTCQIAASAEPVKGSR